MGGQDVVPYSRMTLLTRAGRRRWRRTDAKVVYVLILLSLLLLSCEGGEEDSESATDPEFSVDRELLGPEAEIPELGISLFLPIAWEEVTPPDVEQSVFRLARMYSGPGPSYLLAGTLSDVEDLGDATETVTTGENPEATRFVYNGIEFVHLQRYDDQGLMQSFLFVVPGRKEQIGMLRYVLPDKNLDYGVRLLESSFGSVEALETDN